MGRLTSNKGFLLAEVCIVLLALGLFSSLSLSLIEMKDPAGYRFCDRYLRVQSEALCEGKEKEFEENGEVIGFNEKGNVRQARTLYFDTIHRKVVIELGGGRLIQKPEGLYPD
jgi:hypothetical protein